MPVDAESQWRSCVSGLSLALQGLGLAIAATLALALAFAVVGQGFAVAVLRGVRLPPSISLRVALGIVVAVVIVPFGYLVRAPLRGLSYGILLTGTILSVIWLVERWRRSEQVGSSKLSIQEPLLAFVGLIVLSPVAIFGLTYWTLDANDMPAYAAFANVWLSGSSAVDPGQFTGRHPDPYGQWAVKWADFDKLGVSGVLTFSSALTGVLPMQLQTPITLLVLLTTLGLVFELARGLGCSKAQGAAVAIMISLGLLPINFLLNGQLGHIVAVLSLFLSILMVQVWSTGNATSRKMYTGLILVVGSSVFAALMANILVSASVLPVLITAWVLVMHRSQRSFKQQVGLVVSSLVVGLVLLAPFLERHLEAVTYLGTGAIGPKFLLASPLGMIGLQWSLDSITQNYQILILWLLVGALGTVFLTRCSLATRARVWIAAAIVTFNGAALGLYLGFDNYGFAKWTAVASMLLLPFVLSFAFRKFRNTRGSAWISVVVAGAAVVVATHMTASIPFVVPRSLFAVAQDPRVSAQSEIGIDLGNYFEDATAAAILANSKIYVLRPTHADGANPGPYRATLVRLDGKMPAPSTRLIQLDDLYGLLLQKM